MADTFDMEKLPISLCMIVRNEADDLENCLASAWPLVSQVIIVDTGSEDETAELAERIGAEVYKFRWRNDFAVARNFSLTKARQPWILILDADETIDRSTTTGLSELLYDKTIAGAEVEIHNKNDRGPDQKFKVVRLFRRHEDIRFEGAIHEGVTASLLQHCKKTGKRIVSSDVKIIHFGYLSERIRRKGERNLKMIREKLARNSEDLYLLLKEYEELEKLGRVNECDERIMNAFKIMKSLTRPDILALPFAPVIVANYSQVMLNKEKYEQAVSATEWGISLFGDEPWCLFFNSLALMKSGNRKEARAGFLKCLELDMSPRSYYVEPGIATWLTYDNLAEIELALKNPSAALDYVRRSMAVEKHNRRPLEILVDIHLQQKNPAEAMKICVALLKRDDRDLWALVNGAQIMANLGIREKAEQWLQRALEIDPALEVARQMLEEL